MIDILMSTYNGEEYIKEQIDSIFSQTSREFNLIIRDDGSTDKTINIIKEYQKKHRNVYLYQDGKNYGACLSFLELLKYSSSEYIMFCDQDDVWLPNKIEILFNYISKLEKENQDKPLLVFGDMKVVDESLNIINQSFMKMSRINPLNTSFTQLLPSNRVPGCACIFNRKLANFIKSSEKAIIMHDYWIALIASCFGKVFFLDEKLNLYRQHANNVIGVKQNMSINRIILITKAVFNCIFKKIYYFDNARYQAKEFMSLYEREISESRYNELDFFIHEKDYPIIKRISLLRKYGFFAGGLGYRIGLIFF